MALLDELKQEAERIRREGSDTRSHEEKRREFYEEHTKPTLQRIYVYLNELREHLNMIKPIAASYEIPGIRAVETMARNYVVQIDSSNLPTQVGFLCTASAAEPQRGMVQNSKIANELRDIFNRNKQLFSEWPARGLSGVTVGVNFEFTLNIPVSVHFLADLPNMAVQMVSTNLEGFRTLQHRMKPAKVNAAWLDKLGLYILRRGPDPSILILSDEEREKIRRHLRLTQDRERWIE